MRSFPLHLAFLCFTGYFISAPPVIAKTASCSIVARVLESPVGSRLKPGDGICEGQPIPSEPIRVACPEARKILLLQKPEDIKKCGDSYPTARRCAYNARIRCARMRGEISLKPFLISPYGEILSETPSKLRWISVKDADHYVVNILGDKTWKFTSAQPFLEISIPSKADSIEIVIEAFEKKRLLSTSTTTFVLLGTQKLQHVKADIALIDRLQISAKEKKSLKLSVYSEASLLDNSISLVRNDIKSNPKDPSNVRLLGDIFLASGLLDEANENYKKALEGARKNQNQYEIDRSNWGLRQVISMKVNDEKIE